MSAAFPSSRQGLDQKLSFNLHLFRHHLKIKLSPQVVKQHLEAEGGRLVPTSVELRDVAIATALNYLDRQSFPVVVGEIRKEIPISDQQYGELTSLFLLAYAIMYAGGGRIMDRLGTRVGYTLMILWWSTANFLMGTVNSVSGLGVFRFLLGMGEGGGFPGSGKAVSEWFPQKERSMAFGLFNTGSSIGAVMAPPLLAWIVWASNWRCVFFFTGLLGFVWALLWLRLYRRPADHPQLSPEERHYIATAQSSPNPDTLNPAPAISWFALFRFRQVWGLMMAKFLTDAAWYFFIFWLPKYLLDARHLNLKELGSNAWIPPAFMGAGSLLGGWLSSFLLRKNVSLDRSRKIVLVLGAGLMPVSLFIVQSPLAWAIFLFNTAYFAHQFFSTIMQTLGADIFPSRIVGSVEGLMGAAGAFGGMLFNYLVGFWVGQHGYSAVFFVTALLHPIAFLIILFVVKKVERTSLVE